jgi:hypothetical protein
MNRYVRARARGGVELWSKSGLLTASQASVRLESGGDAPHWAGYSQMVPQATGHAICIETVGSPLQSAAVNVSYWDAI